MPSFNVTDMISVELNELQLTCRDQALKLLFGPDISKLNPQIKQTKKLKGGAKFTFAIQN